MVRVILRLPRWEEFARSCLDDLIAAASASPMVLLRIRDLLARFGDTLAREFPLIWAGTATARKRLSVGLFATLITHDG